MLKNKKRTNKLIFQYSGDPISNIDKRFNLSGKLGNKIQPISHQKAIIATSKTKREIEFILNKFNRKHNQRIRI